MLPPSVDRVKYLYNRRTASFMFAIYKNNTDPRLLNLFKTCRSRRSASNFEVTRPLKEIHIQKHTL